MSKHSAEPWRRDGDSVFSARRGLVADCYVIATGDERIDVARRIVAAVNATAGISTEALEGLPVGGLAELLQGVAKMREAIRKAIQLAEIATDWDLNEVEIDGVTVSTFSLKSELRAALPVEWKPTPEPQVALSRNGPEDRGTV